ncbi:LPS export ABC transporter periplasmic protein LptC [Pelistega sp. NLN82]|uniref:LPS export ABC transporter periplasmic protein LptC n=1 Tax=Pelistega ratti TaxID=2652177 RepID=A0A6L9Y516_9BURK|nr:LPS export ABC transporter periplasmic protein LptC [Pelistega ratti]NEN74888.1 LPS export ABC transporter periplasmic protein LptC [Pelistega ratti]
MKERLPTFIALFLLIILVIATWWAADYTQRAIPIEPPVQITHEPDAWSGNFVMISSDNQGIATNRLTGTQLVHYPDDDSYEASHATLFGIRPDTPRTQASADKVTLKDKGDFILMQGNAHIHRFPSEDTSALDIRSEELTILPNESIIKTDKPADVLQGNSRMQGKGMIYNNKTRRLEVFANTDVVISPQDINKANKDKP